MKGKFPEWGATFGETPLDDLSINKSMSCSTLNQTEQHFCGTIILTEYFDDFMLYVVAEIELPGNLYHFCALFFISA